METYNTLSCKTQCDQFNDNKLLTRLSENEKAEISGVVGGNVEDKAITTVDIKNHLRFNALCFLNFQKIRVQLPASECLQLL